MNETEQTLRDVLADWASGVSARPNLADAVLARGTRRRRRRRVVVSVLAACVVVAGVVWGSTPWFDEPQAQDRLVPAASPRSAGASGSPVDFTWLPDGFGNPRAEKAGPEGWRLYATGPTEPIVVTISPTEPEPITGRGKTGTTDVNGITATTYSVPPHAVGAPPYGTTPPDADGGTESLTFQRKPGQWVRIYIHLAGGTMPLGVTGEDLRHIARTLIDRERKAPDLVTFAHLDGMRVAAVNYAEWRGVTVNLVLTSGPPAEEQWLTDDSGTKSLTPVMVYLGGKNMEIYSGFSTREQPLETRQVGDRTIIRQKCYHTLWNSAVVKYADGQIAVALVPKTMSSDALMTFASGITPGPDYTPVPR
ncbi:hypothetical protein [Cryptosporangium sp. NPDC048952]|uniref:hypothetical protein n=1 Tax=Cryptosporangium sp. NPDC048952 TaxID=3363961 RepID=UPI0037202F83